MFLFLGLFFFFNSLVTGQFKCPELFLSEFWTAAATPNQFVPPHCRSGPRTLTTCQLENNSAAELLPRSKEGLILAVLGAGFCAETRGLGGAGGVSAAAFPLQALGERSQELIHPAIPRSPGKVCSII